MLGNTGWTGRRGTPRLHPPRQLKKLWLFIHMPEAENLSAPWGAFGREGIPYTFPSPTLG